MAKSYSEIKKQVQSGKYVSNNPTTAKKKKTYAEIKASLSDYDFGVDESYINSFLNRSRDFFTNSENDSKDVNFNNASSLYSKYSSAGETLQDNADTIRAYYNVNKNKIDTDSYNSMIEYLDSFDRNSPKTLKFYRDNADFYSQWETEDDYNRYNIGWLQDDAEINPEKAKARKDYYNSNVDKIADLDNQIKEKEQEIRDLGAVPIWNKEKKAIFDQKSKEHLDLIKQRDAVKADNRSYEGTQGKRDQYFDITEQANFESDSNERNYINPTEEELKDYDVISFHWYDSDEHVVAYYDGDGNPRDAKGNIVPQMPNAPEIEDKLGLYLSTSEEDRTRAMGELTASNGNIPNTWANVMQDGETHRWDLLEDTEIGIYYTLLKNNGKEAAYKFLDDMAYELTRRENKETQKIYDGSNTLEKIGLSLATVPYRAIGSVAAFADDVSNLIQSGEINPYTPAHRGNQFSNVIRSKTANEINEATGNAKIPWLEYDAGQVYQAGMSMVDSFLGGKLFGPAYSVVMGMGSASDEAQRLYEQGASTLQATTGGFLAGAAETIFEYISLDHLLNGETPKTWGQVFKQALAQGGVEASEEVFTEISNTLTNAIVMGSQSDWQSYRDKYIKLGYTDAQATVKALFNDVAPNVINAGIGGFLSGVAMGGVNSAINYGLYNLDATQTGKVIAQNNNTSKLVEQTKGLPNTKENLKLKALAEYVESNASDSRRYYNTVGKLYDSVQEAQIDQFNNSDKQALKKSIKVELEKKGIKNIDEAAEVITKAYYSQLSSKESKLFDSVGGKEILNTVLNSKDIDNAKKLEKISNYVDVEYTKQLASEKTVNSRLIDSDINVDDRVSDDGKTTLASTGEEVSIKEIASIEDGKMQFRLNDGTIVDSADINYSSEQEALSYETILNLGVSYTIGNNIIKSAKKSNIPTDVFMQNVMLAYDYGITNESSRLGSIALPKNIRNFMFQTGREYAQKHSKEMLAKSQSRVVKGKASNKVTYVNKINGKLNEKQKAMIHVAEFYAKTTSLDINVFQSYRKGVKVYANINGVERETSANGWFVEGTNKIYIDINAGGNFDGLGLFTLAHESGHFIRSWNATEWQTMADVIVDIIDKQAKADSSNPTFEEMLAKKYNKYQQYKKNEEALIKEGKLSKEQADYAGRSDSKLRDMAYEDVICDSLASLMSDKETFVEFANKLDKKDHKLWVKFKELIKSFLDKLDEWLKSYNGVNTEDEAGQAIQNATKEARDIIRELYVSAFIGANENYNKAVEKSALGEEPSNKATQKNTAENSGDKFSERYEAAKTNIQILELLEKVEQGNFKANEKADLGVVPNNVAIEIERLTGINVNGFKMVIEARQIEHIIVDHGKKGKTDHSMSNNIDIAKMEYVINNYDDLSKSGKTQAYSYMENGRNKTADTVLYEKQIGEKSYYVVQAVPNTKAKTLYVVSAFIGKSGYKKETSQLINAKNLDVTAKTGSVVVSNNSISNPTENVKENSKKFSMRENVEETKDLIAVHNMQTSELEKSLALGGLPMPSIAIIKAKNGHSEYGDVSLVFNKDTIDPQLSKDNKVYGGDAWTPTYPTIEYKANEKVAERVSKLYYDFAKEYGYDEARPLYNVAQDLEDELNRHKGEAGLIDYYKDDTRLMNFYLIQSGKGRIEPIMKETRTELSEAELEECEYLVNALGEDIINEIKADNGGSPMARRKAYFEKNGSKIETAYKQMLSEMYDFSEEQIQNVISQTKLFDYVRMINSAYKYLHNETVAVKVEEDSSATKEAIRNAASEGYSQWLDDLFKGAEEKSGIRNNVDYFTPSGNRRSFEATHWENNLENVVRAMKSEDETGGGALISGLGIYGVSAKKYKSIDEIKADSDRLTHISEDEYKEIKRGFGERLGEIANSIMDKTESNPFIASDNACECIVDAIRNSKTKSGILNNLKQYRQLNVTETAVDDIVSLVSDIANMPTEYFEAKPRRAVGFDEVAAAIIPDNASEELKNKLSDIGVNIIEYESGNEESRLNALNGLEDLKFSDRNLDMDNRTLLSNALASTAQNEIEKKYIEQYQEKIDTINAEQKKLTELRAKIKELSFAKGHRDLDQIRKLRDEATKATNRINIFDKQLLKLESAKPLKEVLNREKALAKKKAEKAGREALDAYKERATKTQRELMDRYQTRIKKGKESRDKTELRHKIRKIADDFKKRLLNGSNTRYVPKNLVEGIISVCNEIDPTGKDQNTKVAEKYRSGKAALAELKLAYDSLKTEDYEFSSEFNEEFSKNIEDLAKTVGDTPLRDMSKDQLEDVYNIIHDIKAMLQDATKQIGTSEKISNYEAGQEVIALMQGIKGLGLTTNEISSFFRNWMENPMRAVREMSAFNPDSRLVKLFNALNEGRRKMDTFRMEANKEFDELRSTKEGEKNFNDAVEKAHDFGLTDINGNPLKISKMQAMQLVLTWNREQANENRKHLQSGAIIPDVDLLRKGKFKEAFDNGQQIGMVTPEVIAKIMDGLSEWDKQYMETARKFFNGKAKDAVNETSMITRHRIIASEKEYIPYEVNKDYVSKDSDNVKFDATIEGMGMLKSVKNNAPQMLVMGGLNSILADHIDNVGKLYGLSVPIRNWNKVFNMRQTDADGGMSVKAAIRNTWKDAGVNLLDQAVADLQTPRRHDSVKLLSTIKSAQVASTLASNISVWMKQAASYPTAGAVLSQKALTKGLKDYVTKIKDGIHAQDVWDEIDAHTSQHWIRRQGLSMQELGDFNQSKGWLNKVNKKLGKASPMNWIQAMDVATTAALWYACKSEVDSTGVSKGSDEYWEAVTELYDKVIEETQPMYDSLHRAEITKKDQLKNFIMFQTQPLQNSGILREGAMEYKMAKKQYGKDSKVTKQAGKKFRMAVGSQMASHFVFTAMTLIAGMLLHKMNPWRDDDDELTAENFAIQFSKNYFNAIVPIIGNYATSLCEVLIGGSRNEVITDFTVDRINTTINTFAKLKEPTFENFANAFCEIASYFGIPASNAKNIVNGIILHAQDAINGEFLSFEAGVDRTTGQEVDRMYSAYESGDTTKMNSILNELIQEKIDSGKDEKEAKSAIRASITSKYKPIFLKAYSKNDTVTMAQIRKFLNATGIYDDVVETTQNWIKQSKQSK